MENQVSSKSVILNYGLYYGIVSILLSLSLYAMNMHLEGGTINIVFAIAVTLTFPILGIYKFKKDNSDFITWGQSVKIGIGIILIGVLITIIYNHIFTTFIEPDFYNQMTEIQRQALIDAGLTQDQIETQFKISSMFQGTILGDAVGLLFFAFVGFVISAIAGAIMKRTEEDQY
jgi:amino acid transporter